MRTRRGPNWRARFALAVVAMLALAPAFSGAAPFSARFGSTDIVSSPASMQQVALATRMARVAYVPGTKGKEAWGIALSSASGPGWHVQDPSGQVLFMHYLAGKGWQVYGPPRDAAGTIINPALYALDIAPNGEGWAVGEQGVLVRHTPGGGWIKVAQSGTVTKQTLHSVSLVADGPAAAGFAVGEGPTLLFLKAGQWAIDTGTTLVTEDLTSVSAASAQDAWAVSGNGSPDLHIYHRSSSGWAPVTTGDTTFDGPHPASIGDGMILRQASGASVSVSKDGAWVGGVLYVTNAADPFGDDLGRPFALHVTSGGAVTSYCPVAFKTSGTGPAEKPICSQGFPAAQFDLTSLSVLPDGQVFASGLGLFHFRKGAWQREPDTNGYLISTAFASDREGWVASTGNIYGAGGTAYSSVLTVGHWTADPEIPRMARWPQPNRNTLEAVAVSPDGNGDALAVGFRTALVKYTHGRTWDRVDPPPTNASLHGIAWPKKDTAWAVGEHGAILRFDGTRWDNDPASESISQGRSLFGVAFEGDTGYAVGAGGTILRHGASGWRVDAASRKVTSKNLYSIVRTTAGFVAVGDEATFLQETAGVWHAVPSVGKIVTRPGSKGPAFSMVTMLTDGSMALGGGESALLTRAPGSPVWKSLDVPVDGTIIAVAGSPGAMFVSVSRSDTKYAGDRIGSPDTVMLLRTPDGWRDVMNSSRRSIYETEDPSLPTDGLFGIIVDKGGRSGWAVGGMLASTPDEENHAFSYPSAAAYRIDLDKDPSPPSDVVLPRIPAGATSFAFFSESSCSRGICAEALGSGQIADVIPRRIQEEINTVGALPNGPKVVLFGGSGRLTGHPDELAQFRSYLAGFDAPVYGAVGSRDLFSPPAAGGTGALQQAGSSNTFWVKAFANEAKPWGNGSTKSWIKPVDAPVAGQARTHYAFDVLDGPNGKALYRVIVLDSSRKSLGGASLADQSPREDQLGSYLPAVLQSAVAAGIPSIVMMNQPTLNPLTAYATPPGQNFLQPSDASTFDTTFSTNGGIGVFQGGFPVNAYYYPADIQTDAPPPFFVSGGGGRAFEFTKVPTDGFFPAWLLAIVQGEGADKHVTAKAMPVLDSIALHAQDGLVVPGGNVLRFNALARFPDGGYSDPEQSKARYMDLPPVPVCEGRIGPQNGQCFMQNGLLPDYQFSTSDSSKAMFVKWDFGNDRPAYDIDGNVVPDPHSSYMCTFESGEVTVYVTSGLRRDQAPVTVNGGKGPCVEDEVAPQPTFSAEPKPVPKEEEHRVSRFVNDVNNTNAAIFPPIPAPVVAPAPPGAPGVGRKEEHEPSHETEGHGQEKGKYQSIAVVNERRGDPVEQSWMILGSVAVLSFMSAAMLAWSRQQRPVAQRERSP